MSGQTIYSAEDRDIRGAEQDYKKLEKELDKKIDHAAEVVTKEAKKVGKEIKSVFSSEKK